MRLPPDPRLSRARARAVGQGRFHDPEFRCTRGHVEVWRYTVNGNCCQCTAARKDPTRQAAYWQRSGAAAKRRQRRAEQRMRGRVAVELDAQDLLHLRRHQQPGEPLAATLKRLAGCPPA
jgi:hypothetical protein